MRGEHLLGALMSGIASDESVGVQDGVGADLDLRRKPGKANPSVASSVMLRCAMQSACARVTRPTSRTPRHGGARDALVADLSSPETPASPALSAPGQR